MAEAVKVRDDEEQEKKCLAVMELLVAAGYFRARIKVIFSFRILLLRALFFLKIHICFFYPGLVQL
jgi:hypothetical protein